MRGSFKQIPLFCLLFAGAAQSASAQFSIGGTLPQGNIGVPYSTQLSASGGTAPYHFALPSVLNPAWLAVSESGLLTGTPPASGVFSLYVDVSDSVPAHGTSTVSLYLNVAAPPPAPLQITTSSLPPGIQGANYNGSISVQGGVPPYNFYGVSLPGNLQVSLSTGAIYAEPLALSASSYPITVSVWDSATPPVNVQKGFTLSVSAGLTVIGGNLSNATFGQPYSQQLTGFSGTAPFSFAVVSGSLPPGLTLNPNSAAVSGTPTHTGNYVFGVQVTDASGLHGTANYFLNVNGIQLSVTGSLPSVGRVGETFPSVTFSVSGGVPPYMLSLTNPGSLPPGFNFDGGSKTLSGTPTQAGGLIVSLLATDQAGNAGTFFASATLLDLFPPSLDPGAVGQAYDAVFLGQGFPNQPTISHAGGTLPPGLTVSGGHIAGTPSAAGTFNFTIQASSGPPYTYARSYSLVIAPSTQAPLQIIPAGIPSATVGQPYSQAITSVNGTAPYTASITAGSLPPGLTLSTSGLLSGTPTSGGGSVFFEVRLQDSVGRTGTMGYTIFVQGPAINVLPSSIPNGSVGQPYSVQFSATGGFGTFTFGNSQGIPGVTLDALTGLYSGVPIQGGTFTVTVSAESGGNIGQRSYTVTVAGSTASPLTLSPSSLPGGTVGLVYNQSVYASGAGIPPLFSPPASWSITSGSLPPGLILDGNFADRIDVKGTPTSPGTFSFTLKATDAGGHTGSAGYSVTIVNPALEISPSTIPPGTLGVPYAVNFTASGGTPPYTFSAFQIVGGELGFAHWISSNGAMQGLPTATGNGAFLVRATDSRGVTSERSYLLTIVAPTISISPTQLPDGALGQSYSAGLSATGGTAPYTFTLNSGALPGGVSLSTSGAISGTPNQAGSFTIGVLAHDANGSQSSRSYSFLIQGATLTLGPASLPDASSGQPYSAQITTQGGTAPYTYSMPDATSWDAGLTLQADGSITGSPQSSAVTLSFTVAVTDAHGSAGSRTFQIVVHANGSTILSLTPATLAAATVNKPYSAAMSASGGLSPYVFSLGAGTFLPAGLQLAGNGEISGTPTAAGGTFFTVVVQDANGATGSRTVQLTVQAATVPPPVTVTVTPASLPAATFNRPYSATMAASGGLAPYVFSLGAGSTLPPGLQLATNGGISGTPTTAGVNVFVVEARDANGVLGSVTAGLSVLAPLPLLITPIPITGLEQNVFFSTGLQVTGGVPPYQWELTQGVLPPGVVLLAPGILRGTPAAAGQFAFTLKVTDSNNTSATTPVVLLVAAAPTVNTLTFAPTQISFTLPTGTTQSEPTCISVFSTQRPTAVTASLQGAGTWATVSGGSTTPAFFCVVADPSGLVPGTYQTQLSVSGADAQPSTVTIPISLTVRAPLPASLLVSPSFVKVSLPEGSGPTTSSVLLTNSGASSASFTVHPPTVTWLHYNTAGSVGAASSSFFALQIDPSGLDAGVYTSHVIIEAAGKQSTVDVELSVSHSPGSLSLSQTAMEFVAWAGAPAGSATLGLVNQGVSPLLPGVSSGTTDGHLWLSANVSTAALPPGAATPITVTVNPGTMAPGRYTGWMSASSQNAGNGPQLATIGLTLLPATATLPPDVQVTGLALTPLAPRGEILLNVAPGGSRSFTTIIGGTNAGWLHLAPAQGSVPVSGSIRLGVTADATSLSPGLYTATVGIGLSDGTARSVPVEFFVPAFASASAARQAAIVCTEASPFVAHLLSPVPDFFVKTGRALPIKVQAENCDGSPAAQLEITGQSGTQTITLLPEAPGLWSASWIPLQDGASVQLKVAVSASRNGRRSTLFLTVQGTVGTSASTEPVVSAVVGGANPILNDPIAMGSWFTIYGSNLATVSKTAANLPLPSTLSGIEVALGDLPVPLYYAGPGQVNGLVPRSLSPGLQYQLVLRRDGIPAVPVPVTLAEVQPGLFTLNQQGSGQAAALLGGTATLAAPATPVNRGAVVELYATGLGPVELGPADGAPASLTVLSRVLNPPSVTVGGRPAKLLFAGLTPGAIGLYQINIVIPEDAPVGDAVPVIVTQKGAPSNAATIAIR